MKVSVLSAVNNEAIHLPEMLESVRAQTHEDWELVFVSDGSTDDTLGVLAAAAADEPRILLAGDGSKVGKAAAFNTAFTHSVGELVVLLAGDDTIPEGSLATRHAVLADADPAVDELVAFFKLRTMSENPEHDAMVLPRGAGSSHSGGTITMTRALANRVFPIDESLVAEDLWLSRASEGLAMEIRERQDVVLNYRIHDGNSNPRMRPFDEMSRAMADRHEAWRLLLDCPRFELPPESRRTLETLYDAELLRREGRVRKLLTYGRLPRADRASFAAMAHPRLFTLRQRHYRLLTGRLSR